MKYLAENQMLSLALEGDWEGAMKIAVIMKQDALEELTNACRWLHSKCEEILMDRQIASARAFDAAAAGKETEL